MYELRIMIDYHVLYVNALCSSNQNLRVTLPFEYSETRRQIWHVGVERILPHYSRALKPFGNPPERLRVANTLLEAPFDTWPVRVRARARLGRDGQYRRIGRFAYPYRLLS